MTDTDKLSLPAPSTFEAAMSVLTLAVKTIETNPPESKDDLDRLRWAVRSLDNAAVRAAGSIQEGYSWG